MSAEQPLFLGVDVGGTKIMAVVVTGEGEILGRKKLKTAAANPLGPQVAAAVEGALDDAGVSAAEIAGMGVAVPGVVDSRAGLLVHAPNLQNADPHLRDQLAEQYPFPVSLGNDVNLGTLAEVWRGVGRGVANVIGIFVGTGIGGGVVVEGKLLAGSEDQAGEIGHLVLCVDGPVCGCGNRGCFEALASRTALDRDLRAGLAEGRKSSLREAADSGRLTSGVIAEALAAHDPLTTECMTKLGHYLGQGVVSLRHVVDPDLVILGGGVIEACGDFLMPLVEAEVRGDQLRRSHDSLRVVQSQLGDDAVALGAAALAHAETGTPQPAAHPARPLPAPDPPPAPAPPDYPRINQVSFGAAVVDKRELAMDLYIRADGKLKERKKKLAREKYGTSHVLGPEELEKVLKGHPATLIIGAGFSGMVHLTEAAEAYLRARGVEGKLLPTPEAAEAWNETGGRKALFMHVTC